MDLKVSPDLDAFVCYGIVFLLGLFTAVIQINRRLAISGIWFVGRTWLLFAAYAVLPVALFWLLDRTGAINDTSFFAAILVGVGYVGILSGTNQTIRAPGAATQFWTPFLAFADNIERKVREQITRKKARLVEWVVAEIGENQDNINRLEELARKYSPDIAGLNQRLAVIAEKEAGRGPAALAEEKVRALYAIVDAEPDAAHLLKTKGIISGRLYFFQMTNWRDWAKLAAVLILLVVAVVAGWFVVHPNINKQLANYYIWRVAKANSTSNDQYRLRAKLASLLQYDQQLPPPNRGFDGQTRAGLTELLQQPGLPLERVDLVLQVLLENRRDLPDNRELARRLTHALRGSGVDVRTRIHDALTFLAEYCDRPPDKDLRDWNPKEGGSVATLERQIRKWDEYWDKSCAAG